MINLYALLMIFNAFLAAVSQLLLKSSANISHVNKINEYLNLRVLTGYALLLSTFILNIIAYKGIDYKYGPILNSLSYAFVLVLGAMVLKEKLNMKKVIGMLIIIFGIVVFSF